MSYIEIIGFTLTIIGVIFSSYQLIWAWPINIISPLLYIVLFYNSKLYGDMCLQVMFIILSVYGWINWSSATLKPKQVVRNLKLNEVIIYSAISIVLSGLFYFILKNYTNTDVPLLDGILTALSIVASVLAAKKIMENWIIWIAADFAYVFLFLNKNLLITAILYGVLALLAVYGYLQWKKEEVK